MKRKNQNGFTMVELILTVGLLALVTAAMTSFIGPVLKQLYRVQGQLESSIVGDEVSQYLYEKLTYALDICISENVPLYYDMWDWESSDLLDFPDDEKGYWDALSAGLWYENWDEGFSGYDPELLKIVNDACPVISPDNDATTAVDPLYLPFFRFRPSNDVASLHITVEPLSTKTMYVTVTVNDQRDPPKAQYQKKMFIECINADALRLFVGGVPVPSERYDEIGPIENGYIHVDILKGFAMFEAAAAE